MVNKLTILHNKDLEDPNYLHTHNQLSVSLSVNSDICDDPYIFILLISGYLCNISIMIMGCKNSSETFAHSLIEPYLIFSSPLRVGMVSSDSSLFISADLHREAFTFCSICKVLLQQIICQSSHLQRCNLPSS